MTTFKIKFNGRCAFLLKSLMMLSHLYLFIRNWKSCPKPRRLKHFSISILYIFVILDKDANADSPEFSPNFPYYLSYNKCGNSYRSPRLQCRRINKSGVDLNQEVNTMYNTTHCKKKIIYYGPLCSLWSLV